MLPYRLYVNVVLLPVCWALTLCDQTRISCFTVPFHSPHLLQRPKSSHRSTLHWWNMWTSLTVLCRLTLRRYLTLDVLQRLGPWSMAPQEMKNTTHSRRFTLDRLWAEAYWTAQQFMLPPDSGCSVSLKATQSWRLCSTDSNIKKVPCRRTASSYFVLFFPSLVSWIPCAPNFFMLSACIYWFIWKEHLFIHV